MGTGNLKRFAGLLAVLLFVVVTRAVHVSTTGISAQPTPLLMWAFYLLLIAAWGAYFVWTIRQPGTSSAQLGLTLGGRKEWWPAFVFSLLSIILWLFEGKLEYRWGDYQTSLVLLGTVFIGEIILRAWVLGFTVKTVRIQRKWAGLIGIVLSAVIFVVAYPVADSNLWWLGTSAVSAAIVLWSNSVLFALVCDLYWITHNTTRETSLQLLVASMVLYLLVGAICRFYFERRSPQPGEVVSRAKC